MSDQKIIEQALTILEGRLQKLEHLIQRPQDVKDYLKLKFEGLEHESFRAMFLNNKHGVINLTELFRGTIDGASVYPREVVKAVLKFNAAAVIFAHNHPSGNCGPSQADHAITRRLSDALQLVDIRVLDHIVVGGNESYSFAENEFL